MLFFYVIDNISVFLVFFGSTNIALLALIVVTPRFGVLFETERPPMPQTQVLEPLRRGSPIGSIV